ncbi:MAG: sigma 54-interacting transcriptional regulator, partial [Firmicutes bacterium]|nr:sigma 54-interacting transcriptional regulator [Bacillota bacterium]
LVNEGYFTESASLVVIQTRSPATVIYTCKTGKKLMAKGKPIFDAEGNLVRIVNTVWDITELMNMENRVEEARTFSDDGKHTMKLDAMEDFVARSEKMLEVLDLAMRVAKVDSTVLVLGESGVGKEIIAKIIHRAGKDNQGPFVKVNCASIPENLLESELFGYEKGSFTGASKEGKIGMFQLADGGTILLDEIGEIPTHLQAKLLRVLQDKEIIPVGGTKARKIDVRVIAATNRNLTDMVKKGQFREDLYYRLNVVPIFIPPLRERKEDIASLLVYFMGKYNKKYNTNKKLSNEIIDYLTDYSWPGNVRELQNFVERMIVITKDDSISYEDIKDYFVDGDGISLFEEKKQGTSLKEQLESLERSIIEKTLKRLGSTRKAGKELGIDQSTVVRKAKKYNIEYPQE